MRLGGMVFKKCELPEEWAEYIKKKGYRSAISPIDYRASDKTIEAYKKIAREYDIVIGEVGIWNNVTHTDAKVRNENILYTKHQLELAEELEANCCVNISGTYNTKVWYGPHPDNFSEKMFEQMVNTIQKIIDEVKPVKTFYTLEPSPWLYPDSIESYLEIIKAVDRKAFAVHLDAVNMMFLPKNYYLNGEFLKECIARLGKYIKSCHIKDLYMDETFTLYVKELPPGAGILDYPAFIKEIDKLDPNMPVFIEHMDTEKEFDKAAAYVKKIMDEIRTRR